MYYYTKYWQSYGIFTVDSDVQPTETGSIYIRGERLCNSLYMWLGQDCFLTLQEARVAVKRGIDRALEAAEKEVDRVKALDADTIKVGPYEP